MNGWEQVAATAGPWGLFGSLALGIVVAVLRGELVTKNQLAAAEKRADRWEAVALEAMRQNGRLIPAAEVAVAIADALPGALSTESGAKS